MPTPGLRATPPLTRHSPFLRQGYPGLAPPGSRHSRRFSARGLQVHKHSQLEKQVFQLTTELPCATTWYSSDGGSARYCGLDCLGFSFTHDAGVELRDAAFAAATWPNTASSSKNSPTSLSRPSLAARLPGDCGSRSSWDTCWPASPSAPTRWVPRCTTPVPSRWSPRSASSF